MRLLLALLAVLLASACTSTCEEACANYAKVCADAFAKQDPPLIFDRQACTDACNANMDSCQNAAQMRSCIHGASSCEQAQQCPSCQRP